MPFMIIIRNNLKRNSMLKNDIFLRAAKGLKTERPPYGSCAKQGEFYLNIEPFIASLSGFKELVETPSWPVR